MIAGIYQHYKGHLYLVLGLGHDANADDLAVGAPNYPGYWKQIEGGREVVVYVPLQLDDAHAGARLAVRTAEDFSKPVCWEASCPGYGDSKCGHLRSPRFQFLGDRYDPEVMG